MASLTTVLLFTWIAATQGPADAWRDEATQLKQMAAQEAPAAAQASEAFEQALRLEEEGPSGGLAPQRAARLMTALAAYPGQSPVSKAAYRWALDTAAPASVQDEVLSTLPGCHILRYLRGANLLLVTVRSGGPDTQRDERVVRTLTTVALRETLAPTTTVDLMAHVSLLAQLAEAGLLGDAAPWQAVKAEAEEARKVIIATNARREGTPRSELQTLEPVRTHLLRLLHERALTEL